MKGVYDNYVRTGQLADESSIDHIHKNHKLAGKYR